MDVFNDKQLIAQTYGFFYSRKQEPRQSEKHHPNDTAGGPGERGGVRGHSGPVECVASPLGSAWPLGGGPHGLQVWGAQAHPMGGLVASRLGAVWSAGWGVRGLSGPVERVASSLGSTWPLCGHENFLRMRTTGISMSFCFQYMQLYVPPVRATAYMPALSASARRRSVSNEWQDTLRGLASTAEEADNAASSNWCINYP